MVMTLRRLIVAFALIALFATACSSSSEGATDVSSEDTGDVSSEDTGDSAAGSQDDAEATSIPVPADDSAAEDAIASLPEEPTEDPAETAVGFLQQRFNIDPEQPWVDCIVAQAADDDVLDNALRLPSVAGGDVNDGEQMRSLSYAVNGCVSGESLGDWASLAVGPGGEYSDSAPGCFADRFSDEGEGDSLFNSFVALTFQLDPEPGTAESTIDLLAECTPVASLAEFFAAQAEQTSGFAFTVDRDCLLRDLEASNVSPDFWASFVNDGFPDVGVVNPFVESCSADPNGDLALELPAGWEPWSGSGALAEVAPAARAGIYQSPPPFTLTDGANYEAIIVTSNSEVRIDLFADTAPVTVNNFVNLARDGYYDGTVFHRVLADFMAQGGDPTGTGSGGPGYQFEDEFEGGPDLDRPGLLAMANSGPATNGSQFFITFVPTEWLTGLHTVFGEVTQGFEIIQAIDLRDPAAPTGPGQIIQSITIVES